MRWGVVYLYSFLGGSSGGGGLGGQGGSLTGSCSAFAEFEQATVNACQTSEIAGCLVLTCDTPADRDLRNAGTITITGGVQSPVSFSHTTDGAYE